MSAPLSHAFLTGLYGAVGQITVHFGLIDVTLNALIAQIFHSAGGSKIDSKLPHNLTDRLKFVRKSFDRLPLLASVQEEGLRITDEITRLKPMRDAFTHGYVAEYHDATSTMLVVLLNPRRDMHHSAEHRYTTQQLVKAGGDALQVSEDLTALNNHLLEALHR